MIQFINLFYLVVLFFKIESFISYKVRQIFLGIYILFLFGGFGRLRLVRRVGNYVEVVWCKKFGLDVVDFLGRVRGFY